jgi:hypothetical protein
MGGTGGGMGGGIVTEVEEAGLRARDPRRDLPFTGVTPGGLPFTGVGCSMRRLHASRQWQLRWAGLALGAWVLDAQPAAGAGEP